MRLNILTEKKILKATFIMKVLKVVGLMMAATALGSIIEVVLINYGLYTRVPRDYVVSIKTETNVLMLALTLIDTILVSPLIEELAFRLPLRPSKKNIVIGLSSLMSICVLLITGGSRAFGEHIIGLGLLIFIVSLLIWYRVFNKLYNVSRVRIILKKFFKHNSAIVITSILFGFAHIKVIGIPKYDVLYILLLLSYALSGFVLAKARIKEGFAYCFMGHAFFNGFLAMISLLSR